MHDGNSRLVAKFKQGGVPLTFDPLPGRCQHGVFREAWAQLAPLLFK